MLVELDNILQDVLNYFCPDDRGFIITNKSELLELKKELKEKYEKTTTKKNHS